MSIIPRVSGIYAIVCIATGKCYIGSAVDLYERKSQHFSELKSGKHFNQHLQRAVLKYGLDNFTFKIIELCDRDVLLEREQYYLDWLQPFEDRGFNIVLNVRAAMNGRHHSPETIRKMSATKKGKRQTPEHIEAARIGRINSAKWQAKRILKQEKKQSKPKRKIETISIKRPRTMSSEHRQKISKNLERSKEKC